MRYIRFLKPPRVTLEKSTSKLQLYCLITITSDLGDSFLLHDLALSAELLDAETEEVIVWKTVQWTGGRSLPVTFPISKTRRGRPVKVRIGVEPKSRCDNFRRLLDREYRGTVSAWSAAVVPSASGNEAAKLVQRRFKAGEGVQFSLWEETGESIARHLWDAGITLSCHMGRLLSENPPVLFTPSDSRKSPHVVELGSGCGIVGITIARLMQEADVVLTDLAEAKEIVEQNLKQARPTNATFKELDWEADIPGDVRGSMSQVDLVIAADCTYNPDSSPALVNTIYRLAKTSPNVTVAVAMKVRHTSERVFFDLMSEAGFFTKRTISFPLPGDEETGEETVHLYVYSYEGENR